MNTSLETSRAGNDLKGSPQSLTDSLFPFATFTMVDDSHLVPLETRYLQRKTPNRAKSSNSASTPPLWFQAEAPKPVKSKPKAKAPAKAKAAREIAPPIKESEEVIESEVTESELAKFMALTAEEKAIGKAALARENKAAFVQVLQRAKNGDREAFDEIYTLYHPRIVNAAFGMLHNKDDAEDVAHDVFVRLHGALPTLRADEAFSTYLYRIALNLCRDRARRTKRVSFTSIDCPRTNEDGKTEPLEFPAPIMDVHCHVERGILIARVREVVMQLSEDHRTVIAMHYFQNMEVNEIAALLNVPAGTVKSRLARGRDAMERKLGGFIAGR